MANAVKIVVDAVDKTKKGLTSPIKNVKDLTEAVKNLGPAFAAAATAATAAFAAMARSEINVLDQTAKLAAKLGVSTETLSTMTHASNLAGTSMEGLRNAFKTLGQRAVDSTRGLKSVNDDFELLGVSVTDAEGRMKGTEELFLEIADAISKMEDGLTKAGVASKLMGRQGLDLIPLLNQGAAGIKAMQEEARALGLEINSNTAAQAEKFNDDLVRMKGLATGMVRTFLVETLPALIQVTDGMVQAGKESGFFQGAAQTVADTLLTLGRTASGVAATFKLMGGILAAEADFIVQIFVGIGKTIQASFAGIQESFKLAGAAAENAAIGNFSRAGDLILEAGGKIKEGFSDMGPEAKKQFEILKQNSKSAVEQIEADAKRIYDAFAGLNQPGAGGDKGTGAGAQNVPGIGDPVMAQQKAESFIKGVQDQFNRLTKTKLELIDIEHEAQKKAAREQIDDFGERLEVMAQLAVIYHGKRKELRDEEVEKEAAANEFLQSLEEQVRLSKLDWMAQERQIAEDDYNRNLERATEMAANEQQLRALKEAAEAAHQSRLVKIEQDAALLKRRLQDQVAAGYAQSMGQMAGAAATFFGQESAAFKAFAIAEAIINTYRGANRALAENPWPLNMVAMASVIASGIANVATISGVAHGGIAEVPSDQTFLLKKGERVLSPDQNSDFVDFMEGGGGGASNIELTINLDGDPLWRGLAKATRDGRATISARAIV